MSDQGLEAFLRKVIHAEDADSALSMIAEATEDQGRFMYEGYLRSAFRDLWNEREAATNQTQAERSEAPSPETVIAAAAYRQGREDGLREASEAVGRVQMPEHQGYGTYKGHFDAGVGACRAVLRSLLTDKEGAGSLASTNTKEECPEPMGRCVEHGTWPLSEPYGQCPQCGDKLAPVTENKK